jgi:hypothetical protein
MSDSHKASGKTIKNSSLSKYRYWFSEFAEQKIQTKNQDPHHIYNAVKPTYYIRILTQASFAKPISDPGFSWPTVGKMYTLKNKFKLFR